MKNTIRTLVECYGPSGRESEVTKTIAEMIRDFVDELSIDSLGSLIAVKKGSNSGKKIMFAAHADEIGIVITHMDDHGFLRFFNVGGLNPLTLPGQRVRFANGTIGIIGREKGNPKEVTWDKLYVDIGAVDKKTAESRVSIGDFAIIHREFVDLGQRYAAKSMDDRIGCAILIEAAKRLKATEHHIYFVFTSQEEVGIRGARTSAYQIDPDLGIALDVTLTGDTPEAPRMEVKLGGGAAIKVRDSSMITHPQVKALMTRIAVENKIPYQFEVLEFGGTDAGAIHLSRSGVPSGTISIPCRYVHSASEMVDIGDVEACVALTTAIAQDDLREIR